MSASLPCKSAIPGLPPHPPSMRRSVVCWQRAVQEEETPGRWRRPATQHRSMAAQPAPFRIDGAAPQRFFLAGGRARSRLGRAGALDPDAARGRRQWQLRAQGPGLYAWFFPVQQERSCFDAGARGTAQAHEGCPSLARKRTRCEAIANQFDLRPHAGSAHGPAWFEERGPLAGR